jgi:bifunctional DNA-binding transcriptional regulator/antitoxin component of YhaV-PrlF toxin-antitoxin module
MHPPSVIVRVAKGGRVAIPAWMREMYGLKAGRRVLCIANRDGWLLLRAVPEGRRQRSEVRPHNPCNPWS